MNSFASFVQDGDRWVMTSSTQLPGQATIVGNGHAELLTDHSPAALGAAVRRAWAASATILPLSGDDVLDRSAASTALGYADEDALMRAKARRTAADRYDDEIEFMPMHNRGPKGSFSGLSPVAGPPADCTDAELGQALLDAAERSR